MALLHWGDTIEDFLEGIGLTFARFREEMSGGWMFGYVESLAAAGAGTVLVCVSREVDRPRLWVHRATAATILGLPEPALHRLARRPLAHPYAGRARDATAGRGAFARAAGAVSWNVAGHLATPPRALARELRRLGCSAILCQEYEYARFDVCIAVGRRLGIPVFATYQGGDRHFTVPERLIRPWTVRAAAGLVVGSAAEVDRVRRRYRVAPERIAGIPNPVDADLWCPGEAPGIRESLGIGAGAPVVAWHGRLAAHRKGLDVLLQSWSIVERENRPEPATLLLVGDGPDAVEITRMTEVLGLRHVRIVREYILDPRRVRAHLRAADLYVLPSRHEGFAVAPLEALACGLPVVATDVSGVRDLLRDGEGSGGVVVPPEDAAALAAAVSSLIADPGRRAAMSGAARATALERFSFAAVGERLSAFLTANGAVLGPVPPEAAAA